MDSRNDNGRADFSTGARSDVPTLGPRISHDPKAIACFLRSGVRIACVRIKATPLRKWFKLDGINKGNGCMSDPVDAVLWDFGGVILSSPFEAFADYEREAGLPENFIRQVNSRNPDANAWAQMERSEISTGTFVNLFEAEAVAMGHRLDGNRVLSLLSGTVRPEMVEALRRLRTRYRVACITNNVKAGEGPGMARDPARAAQIAEIMTLFEHVVESSRLGLRKPDPRIYHHTCALLGVAPQRCIYLDDLGINLKPARAMGMRTIKVVDPAQALSELEGMTGLALR